MYRSRSHLQRESGSALIVALLFLLVLSLLAATSMRTATMQERMAGNTRDWNAAFQAAEAALREAEDLLRTIDPLPAFDNQGGFYEVNAPERPRWWGTNRSDGNGHIDYSTDLPGMAQRPAYFIEQLSTLRPAGMETEAGTPPQEFFYFRITAIGYGGAVDEDGDPLSSVVLSTVYRSR